MSDNLPARLRKEARWLKECSFESHTGETELEAADEIERLRALIRDVIRGQWSVTELQESLGDL